MSLNGSVYIYVMPYIYFIEPTTDLMDFMEMDSTALDQLS